MRLSDMRGLLLIVLLSGCSLSPHAGESRAATELAGRVAGQARSCVGFSPGQGLTVLDETSVGYRSGRTLWVSRLATPCHGLDPLNTLMVEVNGSQFCRGDHVRVIEHPLTVPGPICILGDFVPYRSP